MAQPIVSEAVAKVCKKCGLKKPLPEFEKASSCKDGRRGSCKACGAASAAMRAATWRARHPEKAKQVDAKYRANNPAKVKETRTAHYQRNAEKYRVARREYYAENSEQCKALTASWVERNKGRRRESVAAWKAANKDKIRANNARWVKDNPDARRAINHNRRARMLGNGGRISKGLRAKLFRLQRGKCACCGAPLGNNYHLDHIMPLSLGGRNDDGNMQLLKAACNLRKKAKHPVTYMQERGFLL